MPIFGSRGIKTILVCILLGMFLFFPALSHAQTYHEILSSGVTPIPCGPDEARSCPNEMLPVYEKLNETCATSFEDFQTSPQFKHFWIEDPDITAQGKSDERARQFVWWAINTEAIDGSPILREIWGTASQTAFYFVLIVVVIFGLLIVIGQRTNFNVNIKIWPTIMKIAMMLLFVALSAAVVLILIQLSEMLMNFFIERLGGKDLFNIYFTNMQGGGPEGRGDPNYTDFVGCRDLNIRVNEAIDTQVFMLDLTNISYYTMGTMILLRKILLWFLLFASPFLAILMPFIFIRNIGWIWIGVFFQWLFYGPLLALFLGAMSQIWNYGIPFNFNFSRIVPFNNFENAPNALQGYTYPTGTNILYGGPAQINQRGLSAVNNGSYIDTFAEYIISLIMIWAVTFFPWWLLRIFRDMCCDGIYGMRNIMLAWYNQWSASQSKPSQGDKPPKVKLPPIQVKVPDQKRPEEIKVRLSSIEEIRATQTQDIPRKLSIHAKSLADVARLEMDQEAQKRVQILKNPVKAETRKEREEYMNLRTELFNRSVRKDVYAKRILASTSTSRMQQTEHRKEILKRIPKLIPMTASLSAHYHVSQQKASSITNSYMKALTNNQKAVTRISNRTQMQKEKVKEVLNSYSQQISRGQAAQNIVQRVAMDTNTTVQKVREVLKETTTNNQKSKIVREINNKEKIKKEKVAEIFRALSHSIKTVEKQKETKIQQIGKVANLPPQKAQNVVKGVVSNVANNTTYTQQIAEKTNMKQEQVQNVLNSYADKVTTANTENEAIQNIATETNIEETQVSNAVQEMKEIMKSTKGDIKIAQKEEVSKEQVENVVKEISKTEKVETKEKKEAKAPAIQQITKEQHATPLPAVQQQQAMAMQAPAQIPEVEEEKAKSVTNAALAAISQNEELIESISQDTGLQQEQIKITLEAFASGIDTPAEEIAQKVEESAGIETDKIRTVMDTISNDLLNSEDVLEEVAQAEAVEIDQIGDIMQAQLPVAAEPEDNVEKTVEVPPNIALEDYEEVKEMWRHQYEEGEVPVTENIQSRKEWMDQDIVTISNTLNKLISEDEQLKEEGLDELGFILPIFMINNLQGDELIVYLKAKLEAAKDVKKQVELEERLRAEIMGEKEKEEEETLLEVDRTKKKEEPKAMALDLEQQQKEQEQIKERLSKLKE